VSGWGWVSVRNRKIIETSRLSAKFFSGYSYSRAVTCYGYLTSKQKVLIQPKHTKKVIAKLYYIALRRKMTDK